MDSFLIYAKTDSGKTTLLAEIAKYLIKLGMKGRYFYADSGDGPFGDLIGNGVDAFDIAKFCNPSSISKGYEAMAVLNALADGAWIGTDAKGERALVTAPPVDFYMAEGLKTFGDLVMQSHVRANRKIAEDIVGGFTVAATIDNKPTLYASGQSGRAHYNHVQSYILRDWWPRMKALRTKLVFVTSHEAEGRDDMDAKSLGPAIVGQASVGSTTQVFQDALHLSKSTEMDKDKRLQEVRQIFFKSHPLESAPGVFSKTQIWPAKLSLPLAVSQEFGKKFPGGFMPFKTENGQTLHIQDLLAIRGYK